MKRDLLKKISKALAVVLVLGMFVSGTPSVKAEDDPKDIAVGTSYFMGDTINFGGTKYYNNGDSDHMISGNYLVDNSAFEDEQNRWRVNISQSGGYLSLWFADSNFTGNEIVKGVKCSSGTGEVNDPYRFELLYEESVTANIKIVNGIWEEGPEKTYKVGKSDNVNTDIIQPKEGYYGVVINKDGQTYSYSDNSTSQWSGQWDLDYFNGIRDGAVSVNYPRGWLKLYTTTGVLSSTEIVATFQPINYKIKFDANEGSGNMDPVDAQYDTEVTLPKSTMTHNSKIFDGWNTKTDGSGDSYDDEAKVKNLTATRNGEVTLYAQWRDPIVQEVEITDVSLTVTPPCDGDKIVIEEIDEIAKQNPNPTIKVAKDAKYFVPEDGDYILAMWMKETDSLGKIEPFEGTYKDGDDFYLLVGLYINKESYDYEPGSVPATSDVVPDKIKYVFAEALNFNIKGGTVLEYERSNNLTLVLIKGKVDSCKVEPEPKKTTPAAPVAIPMTGVDGIAFSMTDCISLLGICLAGIFLNKKK